MIPLRKRLVCLGMREETQCDRQTRIPEISGRAILAIDCHAWCDEPDVTQCAKKCCQWAMLWSGNLCAIDF